MWSKAVIMLESSLLPLSLCAALTYWMMIREQPGFTRMAFKTASIMLLSIRSFLLGSPWLLVAAEALGAAGDAFLAWDGDAAFLCGLGSFMIAHVLYAKLFLQIGGADTRFWSEPWRKYFAVFVTLFTLVLTAILTPRVGRGLRAPVLVYSFVILSMALASLKMKPKAILGAILFTTSDTILAAEKFLVSDASSHRAWMQYAVWLLYYSGQLLMMLGTMDNNGLLSG